MPMDLRGLAKDIIWYKSPIIMNIKTLVGKFHTTSLELTNQKLYTI